VRSLLANAGADVHGGQGTPVTIRLPPDSLRILSASSAPADDAS
jgi:hypothetical protein